MAAPSFDQAYNTLYKGWDRAAAQADYNAGGWQNKAGADQFTGNGGGFNAGNISIPDPVETAKKLQAFNVQANQPAIQALQASEDPLKKNYQDLIASIKGNQQVAENRQTTATNNELGRRGIVGGGYYDQQMTDALTPIGAQYSGILNQANSGQAQDLNQIALQIAQLQSGNPQSAISGALQYGGLQSQAQQIAAQIAQQQAQQEYQNKALAQQLQIAQMQNQPQSSNPYVSIGEGNTLFNYLTGKPVYTAPKTYAPSSSGAGDWG